MHSPTSLGHVAVIGGCGFLGYHIISLLLEQYPDSEVSALDVRTTNRVPNESVNYHNCDITDLPALTELFKKIRPDVVIHTAGIVKLDDSITKQLVEKVNVQGTKNVLEAAKDVDVKAFVFTSSSSVVVGDVDGVVNADESWPVLTGKDQPEFYSDTKVRASALVLVLCRVLTTPKARAEIAVLEANRSRPTFLTCALRPAGIFGEHDNLLLYRPMLIRGLKTRFQLGSNDNLFDCTYVVNLAHAHLLAARALLVTNGMATAPLDLDKVDGEAFFITNGAPVYFWDLMRTIWQVRGLPEDKAYNMKRVWVLNASLAIFIATILEFVMGLFGKTPNFTRMAVTQSTMSRYFCIDKAKLRLKYEPIYTIEEGIRRGAPECMKRAGIIKPDEKQE
jgi:sterol-4alpha-carboxylate 3-dehydrogenase (decarboxylating)